MTAKYLTDFFVLTAVCLLPAACTTTTQQSSNPVASLSHRENNQGNPQKQLNFVLSSGVYRCELGKKIEIQRDARNPDSVKLDWQGGRYTMHRRDSTSGLPRYEDTKSGLVWIDLPWKSVLLDANSGHPLVNDCKAVSG